MTSFCEDFAFVPIGTSLILGALREEDSVWHVKCRVILRVFGNTTVAVFSVVNLRRDPKFVSIKRSDKVYLILTKLTKNNESGFQISFEDVSAFYFVSLFEVS